MWTMIGDMPRVRRDLSFGGRLRLLREDAHLTQEDLTRLLSERGVVIGRSYISELERNRDANKIPNGEVVAALARALDTTADYLLLLSDEPEPVYTKEERGLSPTTDAILEIADSLPEWRRVELLAHARAMRDTAAALSEFAYQSSGEMQAQLRAAGLIIGEEGLRAIYRELMRFLTGHALETPDAGADRPIGRSARGGNTANKVETGG